MSHPNEFCASPVVADLAILRSEDFDVHVIRATTCDFQQCGILTSVDSEEPCSLLLNLETPNDVQSVA